MRKGNIFILTISTMTCLAAIGCCKSKTEDDSSPKKTPTVTAETAAPKPNPGVKATATATVKTPATPAAANTDPNRPGRGLDGLPAVIPRPTSRVPTLAEWNAAPWEITVAASSPLGCETKMVREWLRVSCRDKNKWGGEIKDVRIVNKGGVQAYDYRRKGVASLVLQVVRNRRHQSIFTWTDRKARLVVDWNPPRQRPLIALQYM